MNADRYQAAGDQGTWEPGSHDTVLRNQLGIADAEAMEAAESAALRDTQEWMLDQFGPTHRFTAADIALLHRHWLGGIYRWAGDYRNVNLAKDGFAFAAAAQIPRLMAAFEREQLAATPCTSMDAGRLAEVLAHSHVELILIHPFRDGNGRCARLLALLMALQAGWPTLNFARWADAGMANYIAAIHAGLTQDYGPMTREFRAILRDTKAAFE